MNRTRTSVAATLLAAAALVAPTAAHAVQPAESGVVERGPRENALIFFGDGLVVTTGQPARACVGDFEAFTATTANPPTGASLVNLSHTDDVWVFDGEGVENPLAWLVGTVCPAVLAGATPPGLLAHGEGLVKNQWQYCPDGDVSGYGGVSAQVTTADGHAAHVRAHGAWGDFRDHIVYTG